MLAFSAIAVRRSAMLPYGVRHEATIAPVPPVDAVAAGRQRGSVYEQPAAIVTLSDAARNQYAAGEPARSERHAAGGAGTPEAAEHANKGTATAAGNDAKSTEKVSSEDAQELEALKRRDREVRVHEQAHVVQGEELAGSASYTYTAGPDGKLYVTAGAVPIDVSPVRGDPAATIAKMQKVQRAALAPATPSGPDRAIAAKAAAQESEARAEVAMAERSGEQAPREAGENPALASELRGVDSSRGIPKGYRPIDIHA